MRPSQKRIPTVVSLFCGCGGLDLGFERAGFSVKGAFDIDPIAIETYNKNLTHQAITADISKSDFDLPSGIDVLLSGSPCQGFSLAGKRKDDDPRNLLLGRACSLAVKTKPKVVVIENVPGALSGTLKNIWDSAVESLLAAGYTARYEILSLAQFGIPQMRRRVILIATRGSELPAFSTNLTQQRPLSLRDSFSNLEGLSDQGSVNRIASNTDDWVIASHIGQGQKLCDVRAGARSVHSWTIPEVFGATTSDDRELLHLILKLRRQVRRRPTGDADPIELKILEKHARRPLLKRVALLEKRNYLQLTRDKIDLVRRFNGKFRRLSWDAPSYTVDTNFGNPKYFMHPEEQRGLTVREAARIQGFPDEFLFTGSLRDKFRLIGNAVPPPAAEALAKFVRQLI